MGRSVTPTYVVEVTCAGLVVHTPAAWRTRGTGPFPGYGKPNAENLAKYVAKFNESLEPGGANSHLDARKNRVVAAQIVHQFSGDVVATYKESANG